MSSFTIFKSNNEEVFNEINYHLKSGYKIINRGNPGAENTLLLEDFDTIHRYSSFNPEAPLTTFQIATTMVEDSIYEVTFDCSGSSSNNNEQWFVPNFGAESNFYTIYQNMISSEGITLNYNTEIQTAGFAFDFVNGSYGYDPVGKITIHNNRFAKKIQIEASDTSSIVHGSGYWLDSSEESANYGITSPSQPIYDSSTIWSIVGNLTFDSPSFNNWTISVRRIA